MAKKDTAVATTKETAVAVHKGWGEHSGKGMENVDANHLVIPFIKVTQDRSAQFKSGIAKEGQIFNSATQTAFDEYRFVPCYVAMDYVQWLPQGGGFVGRHQPGDPEVVEASKNKENKLPNGNKVQQTFYIYGVEVNADGSPGMIICIPFASTMIKPYKNFMSTADSMLVPVGNARVNPPLYANLVKMVGCDDAKFESKNCRLLPADGKYFSECLLDQDSDLFQKAVECYEMAKKSDLSAHTSYENDGSSAPTNEDDGDDEPVF